MQTVILFQRFFWLCLAAFAIRFSSSGRAYRLPPPMASLLNLFKSCRPFTPPFPRSHFTSRLRIQFPLRPGKLTQPRRSFTPLSSSSTYKGDSTPSVKDLWLHNTMSRKKELFKPKVEGQVGMYVCGVTAYDLSHIGHARVYVTFDVLFRYEKEKASNFFNGFM